MTTDRKITEHLDRGELPWSQNGWELILGVGLMLRGEGWEHRAEMVSLLVRDGEYVVTKSFNEVPGGWSCLWQHGNGFGGESDKMTGPTLESGMELLHFVVSNMEAKKWLVFEGVIGPAQTVERLEAASRARYSKSIDLKRIENIQQGRNICELGKKAMVTLTGSVAVM